MGDGDGAAPVLVLGPLLRYVGETEATVWVETDRSCQVEILDRRARTFEVAGHHYALVMIDGLRPGAEYEYQVALDGTVRWPETGSGFPPSILRTVDPGRPLRLVFGSCRIAELRAPRRSRARARHDAEHGADALGNYALDLRDTPHERWPDVMLMIGDQVYADEVGPATRQFIRARRDLSEPPGDQVADFAEYCFLYRETWSEASVRWLLSVIPTAMIFDDHDVHDDWNTSAAWLREYRAKPWWQARITGAYMSYWIYQHLGNLSPDELGHDELWRQVQQPGDAAAVLRDFAARAERQPSGIRWSFRRSFGGVRVVVIDSRSGRVLSGGRRLMVGEAEWRWVTESVAGDWEHVVLATSLPVMLPAGIHALEAWNEAVCDGAWGKRLARLGERVRQGADLEHWAAFGTSFTAFERLLTGLATGAHGRPPASVTVLSGDIHHSYLAAVDLPPGATGERSAVYQAVCSPIHNRLPDTLRRGQELTTSWAGELAGRALARLAGVARPELRWRITRGPWFHNMLGIMEFEGRRARIRFERTAADTTQTRRLQPVSETELVDFMIAKTSQSGQTVKSSRSPESARQSG
jgi:phosphodiesterase/alkaline phosphatase D-like protein